MPGYLCRWLDGSISFTAADNLHQAAVHFDEFDNVFVDAEDREISPNVCIIELKRLLLDFSVDAEGDLHLAAMGEDCLSVVGEQIKKASQSFKKEDGGAR